MVKELLIERGEILENFSREELDDILQDQMDGLFNEVNGIPIDYFKPYYYKYRSMKERDMDDDTRTFLEDEFYEISTTFIRKISKVFNLTFDEDWVVEHKRDIPSVALLIYNFFVLELGSNIEDAVHRAIKLESESLYKLFEDRKNKKDGSTVTYSKLSDPHMGIILANIYDAAVQVIEDMTEEDYVNYLPDGYVPGDFVKKMLQNGYLTGEFMSVIREIFTKSSFLQAMICFNIEAHYRGKE